MIHQYRKKPVVIDAVQWDGTADLANDIIDWILRDGGSVTYRCGGEVCCGGNHYLAIYTLEGIMKANPEDWIIRGVSGEFYPCKPDIFAETYEAV